MSERAVSVQQADEGDLAYVETLLSENDLPAEDVRSAPAQFYVCIDGDERLGVGGLERYGGVGLLRSLVVERTARGAGIGTAICDTLETEAAASGVETLYLLTTTVPEFFADRGYEEIDRDTAPAAIEQTTEFADLCPSTATCMTKTL